MTTSGKPWREFLSEMIDDMRALNASSTIHEVMAIMDDWKRFKERYPRIAETNPKVPPARKLFQAIYASNEWRNFKKYRKKFYRHTEAYKEESKKYQAKRYKTRLKAQRDLPDVKEARNKRRRELYAAKKLSLSGTTAEGRGIQGHTQGINPLDTMLGIALDTEERVLGLH